ncbi:MAG: hypothetical protein IJ576_00170 [Synergistaceae bacterium]|nr:hypothetical protein [Synergistaceae bacterium]MBR1603516.1 hypothetical protein [Synergistaceae bacterium]
MAINTIRKWEKQLELETEEHLRKHTFITFIRSFKKIAPMLICAKLQRLLNAIRKALKRLKPKGKKIYERVKGKKFERLSIVAGLGIGSRKKYAIY